MGWWSNYQKMRRYGVMPSQVAVSDTEMAILDGATVTTAELNKLDDSANAALMTMGTGADGMDDHAYSIQKLGGLIITRIYCDIDGLNCGGTADDIIGEDGGVANCHLGQITAAINGTIIGGKVECLEALAGGDTTISMWSAVEGTGAEDAAITGLDETELMSGADLSATGNSAPLTALPAADEYLYITGDTGGDAEYTAGKILITLYGV